MDFTTMQTRLGELLNEAVPSQWTEVERKAWINEGQYDFVSKIVDDAITAMIVEGTLSTVASQQAYTLPSDFLRIREVSVDGAWYKPIPMNDIQAITGNNIYYTPSTNDRYYLIRENKILLYPTPAGAGVNNIVLWYTKLPAELTGGSDTSVIPSQYHQHVVLYALVKGMEKYGMIDKSTAFLGEYHAHISAINQRYAGFYDIEEDDQDKTQRGTKK